MQFPILDSVSLYKNIHCLFFKKKIERNEKDIQNSEKVKKYLFTKVVCNVLKGRFIEVSLLGVQRESKFDVKTVSEQNM